MKTKRFATRTFSVLLALALCVPMLLGLAAPASAASGTIAIGIGTNPCQGNYSSYSFPTRVRKSAVGQQLYVNVAATSDIKLKSIEAYASVNGGAYALVGRESARNYMRWAYFPYTPTTAGTTTILIRVYYLDGKSVQGTTTLTVSAPSASAAFNPVWPASSAKYISTLYYYWKSGKPTAHLTRSDYRNAIDIMGSGNVLAAESGTVVTAASSGWNGGFGKNVVIRHSNGLYSLYGHMDSVSVRVGQSVSRGQTIGTIGNTGNSTGPHLHFEMYNPSNLSQVINPWTSYYQGKVSVVVGGNSRRANASFPNDAASKAWVAYLDTYGYRRSDGDYQL